MNERIYERAAKMLEMERDFEKVLMNWDGKTEGHAITLPLLILLSAAQSLMATVITNICLQYRLSCSSSSLSRTREKVTASDVINRVAAIEAKPINTHTILR